MNKYKTIGIIGGQGPVSTADFYLHVIKYFQDNFDAKYIRDYPPMIIYSVPTPDLVKSIADENATFLKIADAAIKLEQGGADFIIIACNSLQYLIERLQPLVKIPIIGIAPIVTEYVKKQRIKTVGILATYTTIKKRIYSKFLDSRGIKVIIPNKIDQVTLEEIILNVIGGKIFVEDKNKLKNIIANLQKNGATSILLACTELPLVIKQNEVKIPLINCNELYVRETSRLSIKI